MRATIRVGAVLLSLFGLSEAAAAASNTDCRPAALRGLQKLSPEGYAIYRAMQDKDQFTTWITCQDVQLDLATAVHESVHTLTEERDAYPLIGGASLPRPHETESFFAPQEIAGQMERRFQDPLFIETYLKPGAASSADNFMFLLDELNAFSHDLNSAVRLTSVHTGDNRPDHRDGLAAMMAFVTAYADEARKNHPETWQGLNQPKTAKIIATLWKQAETTMASSCGIAEFGTNDRDYLSYVANTENSAALGAIIGRTPARLTACLTAPVTAATQ
ncbi:hypothetical protein [Brucella sp. IR073]|uniref:hypothetical protein n=1 Tax=unclassified Brucella TaxID=2632610 RepID=UPI003B9858AE